jgi:hypothetical protein
MSDITIASPPRPAPLCRVVEWKPWPFDNPSLIGHVDAVFSGGWRINAIPVFKRADGSLSVGVPSIPVLDSDGRVRLKPDGKKQYTALIGFEAPGAKRRWEDAILGALAAAGITAAPGWSVERDPCASAAPARWRAPARRWGGDDLGLRVPHAGQGRPFVRPQGDRAQHAQLCAERANRSPVACRS